MGKLRCAMPPYYLAARATDGEPLPVLPGVIFETLERGYAPSAFECRQRLIHFRQTTRWSRPAMAAFMGVSRDVLRRWESGERKPSGAARRLIWLLDLLVNDPDQFINSLSLIFWGAENMVEALEFEKQIERQNVADIIRSVVAKK